MFYRILPFLIPMMIIPISLFTRAFLSWQAGKTSAGLNLFFTAMLLTCALVVVASMPYTVVVQKDIFCQRPFDARFLNVHVAVVKNVDVIPILGEFEQSTITYTFDCMNGEQKSIVLQREQGVVSGTKEMRRMVHILEQCDQPQRISSVYDKLERIAEDDGLSGLASEFYLISPGTVSLESHASWSTIVIASLIVACAISAAILVSMMGSKPCS